jgi:hypothetical protein
MFISCKSWKTSSKWNEIDILKFSSIHHLENLGETAYLKVVAYGLNSCFLH